MSIKKLDLSILGDYPNYLRTIRLFNESRISTLCSPIIRLITEKGYSTDQFLEESYIHIYENLTGKPYNTKSGREIRQAVNHYSSYIEQKTEDNE